MPINCSDRITDGHNIRIGEIGYKSNGVPAVFLWCRAHRYAHAFTMEQMLNFFFELSVNDLQLRSNYINTLNRATQKVHEFENDSHKLA